tara:strand:- start:1389 stop:2270 length:882 start_codon:yes stop_codon:yes gene_type:complete
MSAIKPRLASWGNSFSEYAGDNITDGVGDGHKGKNEINYETLNNTTMVDGVEWTHFEENLKDFILARLGHPVVRVELTPYQMKTCIDEAVGTMYNHAPLFSTQMATFQTTTGQSLYEIPSYILNNLEYVVYKKTLLSIQSQAGTLEFDFFIKYFQDNFLFQNFSVGDFYLLQQNLEMTRKILGQEGSFTILDNRYLQIEPRPVSNFQAVIIIYRGLNSDTLHPAYRNWIQLYSLACAKSVLGQIRGKYQTVPSPGGGAKLNGDALVKEAAEEKKELLQRLLDEFEEPARFSTY